VVRPYNLCTRANPLLLFIVQPTSTPTDLSKATKLKDVVFQPISQSVGWVATTLETIPKHRDLREIAIYLPYYVTTTGGGADVMRVIGGENWEQWLDLDRLLVQFWESSLIRPKVVRLMQTEGIWDVRDSVGYRRLLPEITKRGIIDLTG
jgi:hypothetical protein